MKTSLCQFARAEIDHDFVYAQDSIPNISVENSPTDADFTRTAMLFNGDQYKFYCFKSASRDTIYEHTWNGSCYKYAFKNDVQYLPITALPSDADLSHFAMLHSGENYHFYVKRLSHASIYQCVWDGSSYRCGVDSFPTEIPITDFPQDADYSCFDLFYDGSNFVYCCLSAKERTVLYQGAFDPESCSYKYGHGCIGRVAIADAPEDAIFLNINVLHDGSAFRLYIPSQVTDENGELPKPDIEDAEVVEEEAC